MSRGTILCVDNNAEILKVVETVLRKHNFAVVTAPDAEGARERLRENPVSAAVVDVRLSNDGQSDDFSGLNLAREIARSAPVIVFSQFGFDWTEYRAAGVSGGVSKRNPAWKDEIIAELQRVIRPVVYVSHGHSPRTAEVAYYVEKLDLEVCISEEAPGGGLVLGQVEKDIARAEFAVVLLTAEDRCTEGKGKKPQMRARQNVVFEWGYLMAKLGASHVLVLREEGVQVPSTYGGFVYETFDTQGNWKSRLEAKLRSVKLLPAATR
jgi:predicted nucleotide-binding protein